MNTPDRASELELAQRMLGSNSPEVVLASGAVQPVISAEDLTMMRASLEQITVRDELVSYVVDVVRATRENDSVLVGAGPRATQALLLSSRANAALGGRDFVTPDDVKYLTEAVLGHRLVLRPEYEIEGVTVTEVIGKILEQVAVPR
jgi:MoxR-like ATPase